MRKYLYILPFLFFAVRLAGQSPCDTAFGGIIELQMQTRHNSLLYGNNGCVLAAVVDGGLEMVGGHLSIIDGDTIGQVLRWTGTDWEPRLIIFPEAVSGDTSYNGITYVVGTPNAHKLGGTLTESTTISGANTRTLTLNNLHTLSIEAERTGGTGRTTMDFGSTDVSGASLFHTLTGDPNQLANMNVNATTGNLFRLQGAANVLTQLLQYWDGASHVTDITSTDGSTQRTLRVSKTGVFITDLAKVGAFSEAGLMMFDSLTSEVRWQSPATLFSPLAPSEPNRQIVYGTGTGIDSDTTLTYTTAKTLTMKRDSASAEPLIRVDYNDATIGKPMFLFAPRNQSNYAFPVKFGLYANNFPSANTGKPGNHTWRMGFNLGRPVTSLSSLETSFESHYWQTMLGGARSRSIEWHVEQVDTLGIVHRPITFRASHNGKLGDVGYQSDGFYLAKYDGGANYLLYSRFNKIWYWNDTVSQIYNVPQAGIPFASFRSSDGSRLWKIFSSDVLNRLVLNPEANDLYTYSPNFIFHTAAGFRTADGNNISIGNATYPTGLDIYSSNLYALTMRSATANAGADIWSIKLQRFGGKGYFALSTPATDDPFTIRSNCQNALLNLHGNSVGINVFDPTAATLHVNGTVRLQGIPARSSETKILWAGASNDLAVGEISDYMGSGTANYIPKWMSGGTKLTDSQVLDNGTSVGVGNSGTFLTAGRLEVNKSYTNTTDNNIVMTGNVPGLTIRNGSARFALVSNYHSSGTLSLLGGGNTNPTTDIMRWNNDATITMDGASFTAANGKAIFGAGGSVFGATSGHADADFYAAISGGKRFRIQAVSGLSYFDIWNAASGGNRNFTFATSYFSAGQLSLLQSSTAGGTPGNNIFTISQDGKTGFATSAPAQTLHVEGTARITGSDDGTPTRIIGRDADGDISDIALDGLQIAGGVLSQTYDNNEYGNGTHTWSPAYIHVYANADLGNVTLNLSSPFSEGRDYFVAAINNGTNTVTLSGTLYVDGVGSAPSYTLGAWEQVTVRYRDAWSAWFIDK